MSFTRSDTATATSSSSAAAAAAAAAAGLMPTIYYDLGSDLDVCVDQVNRNDNDQRDLA